MAFDAHKNLAIATVATAPSPATSGTTLVVAAGEGARFPAAPFNATVWPVSQPPTPDNAEVVRVTARTADTLTILRAQEGTAARSVVAGDLIAATITAKSLTDIESGTNFPQIVTSGEIVLTGASGGLRADTADGADTKSVTLAGGGAFTQPRGAMISCYGNEAAAAGGAVSIVAGEGANAAISFLTAPGYATRGKMHPSGGFSWGGTTDPGAGNFSVPAGQMFLGRSTTVIYPSALSLEFNPAVGPGMAIHPTTDSAAGSFVLFHSASTAVQGSISSPNASTTAYNTTSDQRLKTDRGVLRTDESGDVLRRTVIHDFVWTVDGSPGRGVFAQEAVDVAPFAVRVGTDETTDTGQLLNPWSVDYSKYVPDLIVGWQYLDAQVAALLAAHTALSSRLATLEARVAALEAALPPQG